MPTTHPQNMVRFRIQEKKTGTHFADMIFLLALDQTKICGTQSPERVVTDVGLSLSLPSLT